MMPPVLLRMRIRNPERRFSLWVPLFLVGPVVLVFVLVISLLLLPFAFIAAAVLWHRGPGRWVLLGLFMLVRAAPALVVLMCSLPGVKVEVEDGPEQVYFSVD